MTERADIHRVQATAEAALKALGQVDTQLAELELEALEGATLELRRLLFRLSQRLKTVERELARGQSPPDPEGNS